MLDKLSECFRDWLFIDDRIRMRPTRKARCEAGLLLQGQVRLTIRSVETGCVLETHISRNIIVNVGKQHICDLLLGTTTNAITHCGVGSGTTAPTVDDTALEVEITPRKAVTDAFRVQQKAVWSTFFGSADNNGTWNESGLFTAETGGIMLCRALFTTTITKDETKTITVDWELTVT